MQGLRRPRQPRLHLRPLCGTYYVVASGFERLDTANTLETVLVIPVLRPTVQLPGRQL